MAKQVDQNTSFLKAGRCQVEKGDKFELAASPQPLTWKKKKKKKCGERGQECPGDVSLQGNNASGHISDAYGWVRMMRLAFVTQRCSCLHLSGEGDGY